MKGGRGGHEKKTSNKDIEREDETVQYPVQYYWNIEQSSDKYKLDVQYVQLI